MTQIRISCGVLLFSHNAARELCVCIVKKRHTYSIMDILNGQYMPEILPKIVNSMSAREQTLLGNFDRLWIDVWGSVHIAHDMYSRGVTAYNTHRPDTVPIITNREPIYEIPKGRPNLRESYVLCATREHAEETGISPSQYVLDCPSVKYRYYFKDMGKTYKYVYFVGYTHTQYESDLSTYEIVHVAWANVSELKRLYLAGQFPMYNWVRRVMRAYQHSY